MDRLLLLTPQRLAIVALVASLLLLAGAHFFESVIGLEPCPLCLRQREAHWTAVAIAALSLFSVSRPQWRGVVIWLFGALTVVYLVGAGIAAYHAGIEWQWWAGPASCSLSGNGNIGSASELLQSLQQETTAPACDKVPWSLFGISMAGYNFLASVALAILSALPVLTAKSANRMPNAET